MTKRGSVIYTDHRRRVARENASRYPWARTEADDAIRRARPYLAIGNEALWSLVTPQSVPRSYAVNQEAGSPVAGTALHAYGRYPWLAEPLQRPWKLVDPSSGHVFPTNDFAAYYASGIGPDGLFDPVLADRSLLVNELYPERGPGWGVDDGFGWRDEEGRTWTFIAYYNHWWLWYKAPHTSISTPAIWDALESLRDAWIFTDDPAYAHAGLVLLDRVADVYPAMDTSRYAREDGFLASDGLRGRGGVVGGIWETDLAQHLVDAYDAFFPALADGDRAGVIPFLEAQARRYGLENRKATVADIRRNIEEGIVRRIAPMVADGRILGNFGMHQHALAMAAVVIDDPVDTPAWIGFLNRPGGWVADPPHVSGGNVLAALVDQVDRDGFGDEAAPHYNYLWLEQMLGLAEVLSKTDRTASADLFAHPRLRTMLDAWTRLPMIGAYTPTIGDTPKAGNPFIRGVARHYVDAFARWGDSTYAQFAWMLNGNSAEGLHGGIFDQRAGSIGAAIEEVVRREGPLAPGSDNLTGYGLAVLRDAEPGHERDAWVYYGRNRGHGHADALNLGVHAFGIDLAPDLGYPEFADHNPKRLEWTENTISHNTVVVNGRKQDAIVTGQPMDFADTPDVKLLDIDASGAYAETERYRRTTLMIRLDAESSYLVDVVDVEGGSDHHFSFHGPEGTVTTTSLDLRPQAGGSYAGPQVPWGPAPDQAIGASGFSWLANVERDESPPDQFSVDWHAVDTWGVLPPEADVHLRLTMLGQVDDVALADGYPATNQTGNPGRLRYLIAHRHGDHLTSRFVSVIEPYTGQPAIRRISRVDAVRDGVPVDEILALRIESGDGRVDHVVIDRDGDEDVLIDGRIGVQGRIGVYRERDGRADAAFMSQGAGLAVSGQALINDATPAYRGTVLDFTRDLARENRIVARFHDAPDLERLRDAYVYVENDGERNAVYRIVDAHLAGEPDVVMLDIGTASPIRRHVDPASPEDGFIYDIAPGASFRIPLQAMWRAPV